jgi:hypothetical protein
MAGKNDDAQDAFGVAQAGAAQQQARRGQRQRPRLGDVVPVEDQVACEGVQRCVWLLAVYLPLQSVHMTFISVSHATQGPSWQGANYTLSTVPTVDWVLLGSGESSWHAACLQTHLASWPVSDEQLWECTMHMA